MQLLEHFKELTLHPKNAEELKGLILQLAVQGKLTQKWREENPDVEPASVLLEKIKIKKRLLSNQKLMKSEGYDSSVTDVEPPFELPETWTWCRLGDITDLPYGKGLSQKEFTEQGYDVFGANGVIGKYSEYLYEEEQLLISCRGAYSGKTNISPKKCFVTSNSLVCDFFDRESTDYKFFFYAITALPKEKLVTGSAQPQVTATNALPLPIALPPVKEQKAIVEVVNQLFAEVEQLEALTKERIQLKADFVTSALNQLTQASEQDVASQWEFLKSQFGTFFTEKANIKKLREAILQLAVQGKLTHHWRSLRQAQGPPIESAAILLEKIKAEKEQLIKAGKIKKEKPLPPISEEEIPYDLPEGWVWCRLGALTEIITSGSRDWAKFYSSSGSKFITMGNLSRGSFDLRLEKMRYVKVPQKGEGTRTKLETWDFLISITGDVGNMGLIPENFGEAYINQHTALVRYIATLRGYFMGYYFLSPLAKEQFMEPQRGIKNSFRLTDIQYMLVPLPPLDEQKAIVEKVNGLMALCDQLEQEFETHQTTQEHWMLSCLREVV